MSARFGSLLLVGLLATGACGGAATPASTSPGASATASAAAAKTPLTFGAVLSLTGGGAAYGAMARGGLDIAVAEINAAGGIGGRQVNIQYEDNQQQPALSATGAQKLVGSGAKIVFVHGSSMTAATATGLQGKDVLLANLAAQSDSVLDAAKSVYSFLPTNNMELGHLAGLAYTKLGLKTLAVEASDDDYGKSATSALTDAFKKLGGQVVAIETHTPGSVDMRTQLIKIRGANPQALAVLANTGEIGHVIKQARDLNINATLMAVDSALNPTEFASAGAAFEGVVGVAIRFDPARSADAKKFADTFNAKYGMQPNNYAAIAYEAMKVIAKGIAEVGADDPAKVGQYLLGVKGYSGILGTMSFNSNRVVEFPYFDWKYANSQVTALQ